MIDNRVVLPLDRVEAATGALCRGLCGPRHATICLVPLLDERTRLLDAAPLLDAVSGDCLDPVKHGACSGCSCDCHRHHNRT